ncbi:MAG: class A beta-lactamase-related serine hydrolase [Gemmatimonadales bacterium]|nr:MAG: class A beta-lactamase-related serine hydrolase [Gemmatimonadales bacterium]
MARRAASTTRAVVSISIMFCLVSQGLAQGAPSQDDLTRRLDAYLTPYADAGWLSGTVLVATGDSVVYLRSFGMANRELNVPFSPDTPSNVASITKPMTIVLAARLAEEGKVSPSDTLSRWIPDFPRGEAITIAHLLNHRAGIPHRLTEPSEETVPHTASDMVAFARRHDLMFEPGSESSYSSGGFSILARVLELAGGQTYGELLREYVFDPAEMTSSAHADSRMLLAGRASPYLFSRAGLVNAPFQDLSFLVGAGSVFATATDLLRMQRALIAGRLGDAARTALLRQGGLAWNGSTGGYRAHGRTGTVIPT